MNTNVLNRRIIYTPALASGVVAGGGPVVFDQVSSNSVAGGSGTLSWTHTPVGTPTAVAVVLENYDAGAAVTGITYGASSMVQAIAQTITGGNSSVQIWGLANPPSGAQTVTIALANSGNYTQGWAVTVTGSNLSTCFDASNSATAATSTTAGVSVTSATGELVVDIVGNAGGGSETPGGSQTQRGSTLSVGTNVASASTLAAGAGSTAMSWTLGTGVDWAQAAASFKV